MEISEDLLCLFTGEIEERDDEYVVRIPHQEIEDGLIYPDDTYRIAVLDQGGAFTNAQTSQLPRSSNDSGQERTQPEPPVAEGDTVDIEIEGLGDQGDGIARVERGFVVIVPDTEQGERVTVNITVVKPTVAFAEVVERHHPKID